MREIQFSLRIQSASGCLKALLLLLWIAVASPATAQVGPWTAHTSMRVVNSVSSSGTSIFAGTSGGIFSLDTEDRELSSYTVVDGLHSVVIQAIAADPASGNLWIGYSDGVLDRLQRDSGDIESFRDIERASQFSSRQVNRIKVHGDSLLIATGFGVVVFDAETEEVRDSYTRLGTFNPGIAVRDIAIAQGPSAAVIWAASAEGVAFASFDGSNLQDPLSWSNDPIGGEGVLAVSVFGGDVYVGTESGLFIRQSDGAYVRVGSSTQRIESLTVVDGSLFAVGEFRLYVLDSGGFRSLASAAISAPTAVSGADGTLWIGDAAAGLIEADPVTSQTTELSERGTIFPDGPVDGLFSQVSIGADGTVLAAGVPGSGRGFYSRSPEGNWTSYVNTLTPEIGNRASFLVVDLDNEGTLWAGSIGGGVASVEPDGTITNYGVTNSSLKAVSSTTDFIYVGGIDGDLGNRTWVTTIGSEVPLHVREPDGTWTALQPSIGQGLTARSTAYGRLAIDSFGQKWIIVRDESSFTSTRGLLVLDTRNTPTDQSDDAFRFFGSSGGGGQGLPSNIVTAVAEDRDGLMWIGTEEGLAYFVNTGIIADDANSVPIWPQRADRTEGIFLLFGLKVNALAVDPANRVWVGTDEGIRIIESVEGGFAEVGQLTTANAPLPSNRVIDIAVYPPTGDVYVVTDAGMVSTRGDATEPAVSAQDLFVYPNPVDLRAGPVSGVYVDGLVEGTTVSIVDAAGRLVRRIEARGGRVRWDGRDQDGALAQSGVYLVVAVGRNGEGTGYGKVAVVR